MGQNQVPAFGRPSSASRGPLRGDVARAQVAEFLPFPRFSGMLLVSVVVRWYVTLLGTALPGALRVITQSLMIFAAFSLFAAWAAASAANSFQKASDSRSSASCLPGGGT